MNVLHKIAVSTAIIGASFLAGCSSDDAAVATIKRADPLAAQTATVIITDPAGTPVVSIGTQPADITLAATLTVPGGGGAGTIDVNLTATNDSGRPITNFKAVTDTAGSTLGTATITSSTNTVQNAGPANGERYVYFGDKLVTPDGKSAAAIDPFRVTLNAETGTITMALNLPTEDLGLVTTDDYSGETEIISVDTGAGQDRVVGITQQYAFVNGSGSYQAANATEGVRSPDGRYMYVGHKTNPYIMVLDTEMGVVDAFRLLDDPEAPNPNTGFARRIATVDSVVMSPDNNFLFASITDGSHPYDSTNCADSEAEGLLVRNLIMKIKRSTMEVVGELDVTPPAASNCGDGPIIKRISMNSNGTVGAAALYRHSRVVIFNPSTMKLIKSVIVNGPADDRDEPHYTAVSPDGTKVYVAYNGATDSALDVITVKDFSIEQIIPTTDTGDDDVADLRFGPDGRLYYARRASNETPLSIFDVSTDPVTEVEIAPATVGSRETNSRIGFSPYGDVYYFLTDASNLYKFNLSDDTLTADSPVIAGTDAYHLLLPTFY